MVPEMRVQVNEVGFCPQHYRMLLDGGNRLGLSLITHTHIQDFRARMKPLEERSAAGGGKRTTTRALDDLRKMIGDQRRRCMLCDRMNERFLRYAFTIVYLWEHEQEFRQAFRDGRGFCLGHLPGLLSMAEDTLKSAVLPAFCRELWDAQKRAWDRMEEQLLAFSGKFDYQSTGGVASDVRESVEAAINRLVGMSTDPGA
jgi:hypothetical protein